MKFLYSFKSMDSIREALISSINDIAKVIVVILMVWLMFANFGISLY